MTVKVAAAPDSNSIPDQAEGAVETGTDKLVEFVVGLRPDNVPSSAHQRAAELVVDHLAGSLHGLSLPWSQIIADYAEDEGGRADAILYGRGRVPARMARLRMA